MLSNRSLLEHRAHQLGQSAPTLEQADKAATGWHQIRRHGLLASSPVGDIASSVAGAVVPVLLIAGGLAVAAILSKSLLGAAAKKLGLIGEPAPPEPTKTPTPRLSPTPLSVENPQEKAAAITVAAQPPSPPAPVPESKSQKVPAKIAEPTKVAAAIKEAVQPPVQRPTKGPGKGFTQEQISSEAIIKKAAEKVGMDPGTMLSLGFMESNFKVGAGADTSTAKGLFQFTKGTWRSMVSKYGTKYGIAIKDILDPWANAVMGALFAKDNRTALRAAGLNDPSALDLYIAHFLGAAGAVLFFNNFDAVAAKILPDAAAANKSIFYDKQGTPRTAREIYQLFAAKMGAANVAIGKTKQQAEQEYDRMAAAGWVATPAMIATSTSEVGQTVAAAKSTTPERFKVAMVDGMVVADKNDYLHQ